MEIASTSARLEDARVCFFAIREVKEAKKAAKVAKARELEALQEELECPWDRTSAERERVSLMIAIKLIQEEIMTLERDFRANEETAKASIKGYEEERDQLSSIFGGLESLIEDEDVDMDLTLGLAGVRISGALG